MKTAWTVDQIRRAEAAILGEHGEHDDGTLMRRAAAGLASVILRELRPASGRTVHLLVGPGNNGGDALFAGAMLRRRNVRVRAHLAHGTAHEAGVRALLRAGGTLIDLAGLRRPCDLIVEGLFGLGHRDTGADPALVEAIGDTPVVAVDIPAGIDADRTVTFGGYKISHFTHPERCGRVDLVGIGLDLPATGAPALRRWEVADVAAAWPVPGRRDHKYTRGVVGVDAGSPAYPGAARLALAGAQYGGAGMVRYVGTVPDADRLLDTFPSVVLGEGRCQAYVAGSGWGQRPDARRRLEELTRTPCVLDADALHPDLLSGLDLAGCLLTPHAGELARLLGVERAEVEHDPVDHARAAADRYGATVLLKGGLQYVARPGEVSVDMPVSGPGWTARAGSGDTLAGVCGALLAAGVGATDAAVLGASLQALTAGAHPGPWPPERLVEWFPHTVSRLVG